MTDKFSQDFGPFEGKIWLNCAHQGPLPRVAAEEAREAIAWKVAPFPLSTPEHFSGVPLRLREALGRLIGASADDIILGNSASYGLHLLANGLPWQAGDEVLLVKGDFPSDILPWLALEQKGVKVRLIQPRAQVLQVDELLANLTPVSKLLCMTWVHSFSGRAIDLAAVAEVCRAKGVTFVLNTSQAVGTRPFNVATAGVDAITNVGFKWLCGPYGTGFCWLRPALRETLEYNQAYWLAMQTADDLGKAQDEIVVRSDLGARTYDVFGTANFFNFKPWTAAVEYIVKQGVEQIATHNQQLVSHLITGLDHNKYDLISPRHGDRRSTLVLVSHKDPDRNQGLYQKLRQKGIYSAFRAGNLRFSPHLYNTEADIDAALSQLNAA